MIKKGDLILVRNKGFIFKKIRKITESEYDHVGIILSEKSLIDSTPFRGVAIRELNVFNGLETTIVRLKDEYQPKIDNILKYCVDRLGSSYDIIQAICLYFFILLGIKKTLDPIDIKRAFVCSELIAEAAESVGFKFDDSMAVERTTPADILNSDKVIKVGELNA